MVVVGVVDEFGGDVVSGCGEDIFLLREKVYRSKVGRKKEDNEVKERGEGSVVKGCQWYKKKARKKDPRSGRK